MRASSRPDPSPLEAQAIRSASAELGVSLTVDQAARLASFAALLVKWNRVYNLTSLDKPEQVLTHHLLDSLSIVPHLEQLAGGRSLRILDVGAGGGLPSIPVALALRAMRVTALDSVQKKVAFLQQVQLELGLANLEAVHSRVEQYRADPFDVIVSRAFATLTDIVHLTSHLLAQGGVWAAMKGSYPAEEINALPSTVELLSAVKLRVPLLGAERHLIVLRPH